MIFPAPGLLVFAVFMLWSFKLWMLILIPIGLLLTFAIWKTSPDTEIPSYYILFELWGAIGSLIWTYIVSGILIDLL
jgi:hypothetical protein